MKKFNYRKLILMLADIFIIAVSGIILNYFLELFNTMKVVTFDKVIYYGPDASRGLLYYLIITVICCVFMMMLTGSYSRAWRYINVKDYLVTGASMLAGFVLAYLILWLLKMPPRLVFIVALFVIATAGVLLFRLLFKRAFLTIASLDDSKRSERTLIVGAGNAGRMILTEILNAHKDANNPSV